MKNLIAGVLICFALSGISLSAKSQYATVSFQVFYDELSPYGQWINDPSYGYVWVPDVGYNFQPYASNGYWAYTNYGWNWVSSYPWGWAPFHYGRWNYDNRYGYVWIPGNQWGPAWVSWRYCDGYYGWTPLGPGYGYGYGVSYTNYNAPAERWIFVRDRDFGRTNINNYYIDRSTNVTIYNKTTVIHNTTQNKDRNEIYIAGPPKADVQKYTGKQVIVNQLADNSKPGLKVQGNKIEVYRPKINNAAGNASPAKVSTSKDLKPVMGDKRATQSKNGIQPSQGVNNRNTEPSRKQNNNFNGNVSQPAKINNNTSAAPGRGATQPQQNTERKINNIQPQAMPRNEVPQQQTAPSQYNQNQPYQNNAPVQQQRLNNEQPQQKINQIEPQRSAPPQNFNPPPQQEQRGGFQQSQPKMNNMAPPPIAPQQPMPKMGTQGGPRH